MHCAYLLAAMYHNAKANDLYMQTYLVIFFLQQI